MQLTNKFNYPATIVKAIENDPYDKGDCDFSATGLIEPPRKRILTERHRDELIEDVDDGIWRLFGQLGHALVERAGTGLNTLGHKHVVEKRFFAVVGDTKISAQIDSLSLEPDGALIDWKFTSVYGFKPDTKPKREWIAQLNIQNYLLIQNGFFAKSLKIWGILRDWRPGESSKQGKHYPNKLGFHDIPMYSEESSKKFIEERIAMHRAAEKELPECDKEDTWGWKRCESYCPCAKFCTQYDSYLKQKRETKI